LAGEVEGVNGLVTVLVREGPEDGWSVYQELGISNKFGRDVLPVEAPVFDKDPIPGDPRENGEINNAEFLPEKVRTTDLVGEALEVLEPLGHSDSLKLRSLGVEDTEVARDDVLVDDIDPDPGLSGVVGICGPQAGLVLGVSIFEELEDNARVVQGFSLISESGDQTFGIESKEGRVLIEWVCLDVFVRNSAFLEGDPTLLSEWAEPTAMQDDFAVGLMAFYGLFG